ncbi:class I SAM-dependent methyltransferase [Streptomyces sp. NPDC094468]|uniref:class I SAM-dependent methyltransferase n=1 Tax=Streptomyces sp. NPDC094468 TaxID=3366066 RepID=UPI00380DD974
MNSPPARPRTSPAASQEQAVADACDAGHAARAGTPLIADLYSQAMGGDYPHEVAANSSCDWPLLGLLVSRLHLAPGQMLVDAGCGTGGIGLWLARALNARLTGFDASAVALAHAASRAAGFVPPGRASFQAARLENTGLPDACAQGVVCVDALTFATDRAAALRELGRILAPGGRLALTRSVRRDSDPGFDDLAEQAGLRLEQVDERPGEPDMWRTLHRLHLQHADALRRELGEAEAQKMLATATRMLPTFSGRRAVLLTLRRPGAASAADTMSAPGCLAGGPAASERTLS